MIYLEITYAQKDEAKAFGVRWDSKEKLWYFPGNVLPKELERFRPANTPKGAVEKIILDIPFSYRDIAARAGVRWDSEIKACFFEKRPGQALSLELEGFEPKQFSWEEKIQRAPSRHFLRVPRDDGCDGRGVAKEENQLRPRRRTACQWLSAQRSGTLALSARGGARHPL